MSTYILYTYIPITRGEYIHVYIVTFKYIVLNSKQYCTVELYVARITAQEGVRIEEGKGAEQGVGAEYGVEDK